MSLLAVGFPAVEVQHATALPGTATIGALVDALAARTDDASLVVTCDDPGSDTCEHLAQMARALSDGATVAVASVSEPPSRAALLLRCLDYIAPYLSPVDLHSVVPVVNAALSTVAVLDTVAKLRRPAPNVMQHGLGLVPGSRFAVDLDADVVGAPSSVLGADVAAKLSGAVASAAVVVDADGWYERLPGAPAQPTITVPDVAPRTFWGARRFVEVTVLNEPLELVVERALQAPSAPCPVCARDVRSPACPYCGVLPTPVTDHNEVPAP